MFQNINLLSDAQAMARHASSRQVMVAQNIANADTPGYKARDMVSFKTYVERNPQMAAMKTSRPGHAIGQHKDMSEMSFVDRNAEQSPDGNTVTVETEMLKSIEAERQHSRAITIYQSSMNILRTSIGRGR